ncbi:MAG TPA: lysophospholipase [Dehalococcoidia bacterium]
MQTTVRPEDDTFTTADGVRLFERRWLPKGAPKAALAIVHGYAEHSGRYAYVGEAIAARGYAVHAVDLRGHGRSEGPRAFVRSFDAYLADLRAFLDRVRATTPGAAVFLLGHSMGGTIVALAAVADRPAVEGILLSGPVTVRNAPRLFERVINVIARVAPMLPLTKLAAGAVSRDPDVVRRYDEDPLVYRGRMRVGLLAAMLRAARRVDSGIAKMSLPVLFMHGTADQLTTPEGSRDLYERAASSDKTLKLYDGLYHEILNEPERDEVIADIAAWLAARA